MLRVCRRRRASAELFCFDEAQRRVICRRRRSRAANAVTTQ